MAAPVTQIIYLQIGIDKDLTDAKSDAGKTWREALDILQSHEGFQRLYWGRSPEDMTKVQLHVVRNHLSQHQSLQSSPQYTSFQSLLQSLIIPTTQPLTRHALLEENTPNCCSLGKGAPVTGTAIYVGTDAAWHEGAWPLWTHIVRYVDGCLGCAGGKLLEPVDGYQNCFLVYVGWETIEKHEAYHHTEHFRQRYIILRSGNKGFREYGHLFNIVDNIFLDIWQYYHLGELIYFAAQTLNKLSILVLMVRVFPRFQRVVYGAITLIIAYGTAFFFITLLQCWPINRAWLTLELHMGIICTSLPAIRALFVSLGAKLLGSSKSSNSKPSKFSTHGESELKSGGAKNQQAPRRRYGGDFIPLEDVDSGRGIKKTSLKE
ncbi:uncharacterized protein BCR38DRAFT_522962 [Pseudomassariella vexata]|uniref:Rhodopsin domain-containing protein n=1 Tax=Pseudomassariella vexata TaxID=1141098 RepID=A0A1Y2E3I2_9PEZI|nr:uncharacterized protein BCR38DRAFT_522962 [Pseudomassariella vexata]ORY66111.1 hypothetical protein BCR38DRAFT_522962 [Pseudomassariella vexata]